MESNVVDLQPTEVGTPPALPPRTESQAITSRQNGRRSRGPVTLVGKDRSRLNAVTHGLFARVIPAGQLPVFADRREYAPLVTKMQSEFGASTSMGRALVESLVLDLLRLRQVRAMEIAIFDPGLDSDRDLEQAIRNRERASHYRPDEDNDALLQAYGSGMSQLRNGSRLQVHDEIVPIMVADLWRAMNLDRDLLAGERESLGQLESDMTRADPAELPNLQELRAQSLEMITRYEQYMKTMDREVFLIEKESDVAAIVSGRRRVPPAMRDRWVELLDRQRSVLEQDMAQVRNADAGIHRFRRRHMLSAVGRVDELNRLAEYEDKIRRSMAKTVTLLKEVEGAAAIDV